MYYGKTYKSRLHSGTCSWRYITDKIAGSRSTNLLTSKVTQDCCMVFNQVMPFLYGMYMYMQKHKKTMLNSASTVASSPLTVTTSQYSKFMKPQLAGKQPYKPRAHGRVLY